MDVVGIALSGLRASGAGLAVQANNVANQLSDGYKAKRVDLVLAGAVLYLGLRRPRARRLRTLECRSCQ